MALVTRAIAAMMLTATPLFGGSGATFTLGLSGEYLSDEQDLAASTVERSNLRAVLSLEFDSHIMDPRFLTVRGSVFRALSDQGLTNQQDTDIDELSYEGVIRLFSNRAVSLEYGAGRIDTDVAGVQQGAIVDGVRQHRLYGLSIRGRNWFHLNLRHWDQSFVTDDPSTLRDEDTRWSELTSTIAAGIVDLAIRGLWRQSDLFGRQLQQEIGSGRVDLNVNRAGRVYWRTGMIANQYRSAREEGQFSPWTQNMLVRNALGHRFRQRGFWELRGDHQLVRVDSVEESTTTNGSFLLVDPISHATSIEVEAGYLVSEFSDGFRFTQPTAGIGLRWGQQFGRWWLSFNPRGTYVKVEPDEGEEESSLGGLLTAIVRRDFSGGSVALEGEYFDNQLTLPASGPGDAYPGRSFLAGLERDRRRARLIAEYRPGNRFGVYAEADYLRRVRVDVDVEVTEEVERGRLALHLGRVNIGWSADRINVIGGDIPRLTDVLQADVAWAPTYWLSFDALARFEDREALDVLGTFKFGEVGFRLNYARLSLYARVREEEIEETGVEPRRSRRFWVGVRRNFEFSVGEPNR